MARGGDLEDVEVTAMAPHCRGSMIRGGGVKGVVLLHSGIAKTNEKT